MPLPHRVYLETGEVHCKLNVILSAQVIRYLETNRCAIVDQMEDADFILINSCGFDQEHEDACMGLFASALSRRKNGAEVICIGCLGPIAGERIRSAFPEVRIADDLSALDALISADTPFGSDKRACYDKERIGHIPRRFRHAVNPVGRLAVPFARAAVRKFGRLPYPRTGTLRRILEEVDAENKLYVLIGTGCAQRCSYCVIKKAKGAPKSRPVRDILADIRAAVRPGQVVSLVADDCASYGSDIGETLFSLVRAIHAEFPSLPLDLTYLHPAWLERHPEEYLALFRLHPIRTANIPLQTGSDHVLGLMNRRYRTANVVRLIRRIKEISPYTLVTAHFILGHPGERWSDFLRTLAATRHFHYYNNFLYSPRQGTASAELPDRVPEPFGRLRSQLSSAALGARLLIDMFAFPVDRISERPDAGREAAPR